MLTTSFPEISNISRHFNFPNLLQSSKLLIKLLAQYNSVILLNLFIDDMTFILLFSKFIQTNLKTLSIPDKLDIKLLLKSNFIRVLGKFSITLILLF